MKPYCYYYLTHDETKIFPRLIEIYKYVRDNFTCFNWFNSKHYITAKYVDGVDIDISLDIFCKRVEISSETIVNIEKKIKELIKTSESIMSENLKNGVTVTGYYFYRREDRKKLIEGEINLLRYRWVDYETIDFVLIEENLRE